MIHAQHAQRPARGSAASTSTIGLAARRPAAAMREDGVVGQLRGLRSRSRPCRRESAARSISASAGVDGVHRAGERHAQRDAPA
jgi:hypothetical protein